jgi:hypothetical protein
MHTNTSFVLDKDAANTFRAAWRKHSLSGNATASDNLLHAVLLGKDPLRAFTPVTNKVKLANGHARWAGLSNAFYGLRRGAVQALLSRITPDIVLDAVALNRLEAAGQAVFTRVRTEEAI